MLSVNDLSMQFGSSVLFSRVDLQFTAGNCYGIIGANGAGKSTFIKILSGELEPTSGSVVLDPKRRMSVLKQNQSLFDDYTVLDTVIIGNQRLYDCGKEKDAIYEKRTSPTRTASARRSLRRNSPSSAAGRPNPTRGASFRVSAWTSAFTRASCATLIRVSRSKFCSRRRCSATPTSSCSTNRRTT